jgi:hypothetical protein
MSDQHQFTVEVLYHFTCGCCNNWWSYAVTPFVQPLEFDPFVSDGTKTHCPHCGHVQTTKIKEGYLLEKNPDYFANNAEKT